MAALQPGLVTVAIVPSGAAGYCGELTWLLVLGLAAVGDLQAVSVSPTGLCESPEKR